MTSQRLLDERESRLLRNTNMTEGGRNETARAYQGRHQSRFPLLGETLNPTALFVTPNGQPARTTQGALAARGGNVTGSVRLPTGRTRGNMGGVPPHSPRFHTPPGHYNNPTDNVYAATQALDHIPLGNSPREIETRRAIDMLRTAVVQQAKYPDNRSGLHGTPYNSHSNSAGKIV